MRVALFTNNYLPRLSGVALGVEALRLGLTALGHKVLIVTPKYPKAKASSIGVLRVPSIRWSKKHFYPIALPLSKKTLAQLAHFKIDLIHSHHPAWLGHGAVQAAKALGVPLCFTYHAHYDKYAEEFFGLPIKFLELWAKTGLKAYMAECDAIIAPTKAVVKSVKAQTDTPVFQIASGIVRADFKATPVISKEYLRANLRLGRFSKIILSVARLSFEKEPEFGLRALAPLLKKSPKLGLLFVGDGLARPVLKSLVKALKIQSQVIFAGTQPHQDLPLWYRAADVFIQPSRFETQGLALIEALACGLPVVARDSAVARECLANGAAGILTAPASPVAFKNAIKQIIDQPHTAKNLARRALTQAQKFDHLLSARNHFALYQNLKKVGRQK